MEEPGRSKSKTWVWGLLLPLVVLVGWWGISSRRGGMILNLRGEKIVEKPYEKYSFENLAKRGGVASKIEVVGDKFYYRSEGRRISGEINLPARTVLAGAGDVCPVVVMARGYVEKDIYKTGMGTHNAAVVYAKNGYITLAPDFSGYGESDPEDSNALGSRLVKPVEILDLLASLSSLSQADLSKVYLWGHSNGGQIMLSVAEILGEQVLRGVSSQVRGVTLWAPVSKPFPYNILFYTDDASDSGKWLRGQISEFEKDYDVFNYSIDKYLDWINIPIQLHQGTADESVPKKWSDDLVKNLQEKEKDVRYHTYPGADHNMRFAWDMVVSRDIEWFNKLAEDLK